MKETWTHWKPIEGLDSKYYIDAINDTTEGFLVSLSSDSHSSNNIVLNFSNSVYSYRSTDELLMTHMIHGLIKEYGKSFIHDWTFFKVNNSHYLEWLSKQSAGLSDYRSLMHFSMVSVNSILDVISNYEPQVTLVPQII